MSRSPARHLRLTKQPAPVAHQPLTTRTLVVITAIAFLVKLPFLLAPQHWEELRDLDTFLRVAAGELPYVDFYWHYGPLHPLLYGIALKILPSTLLSIRVLSMGAALFGVVLTARLLSRFITQSLALGAATLVATAMLLMPNYSHGHGIATVGALIAAYYLVRYQETKAPSDGLRSCGGALLVLLCRPLIAGYAMTGAWAGIMFLMVPPADRRRFFGLAALLFAAGLAAMLLVYGPALRNGLWPRSMAVMGSGAYPNLHHLLPPFADAFPLSLTTPLRLVKAPFDVTAFYFHFFIGPTILATLAYPVLPRSPRFRAAGILTILAIAMSVDVIHYGNPNPSNDAIMTSRGAYFGILTALAWLIAATSPRFPALARGALFAFLAAWSFLPTVQATTQILAHGRFDSRFPALTGIVQDPKSAIARDAVDLVNRSCAPEDTVLVASYAPGFRRLLRCRELVPNDAQVFEYSERTVFRRGESPYTPDADASGRVIVDRLLRATPVRFLLGRVDSHAWMSYGSLCTADWKRTDFGEGAERWAVCSR